MGTLLILLVAALGAMIASVALCGLVMAFGLKDAPIEARKTQKAPVPTAGGVGFSIAAILAAFAGSMASWHPLSPVVIAVAAASMAAMLLGLADDKFNLPARARLLVMLAISASAAVYGVRADDLQPWPGALFTLPIVVGVAGSVLWLVVVVNAVNFMDGANALAMGMGAIASLGLGVCAAVTGAWDVAMAAGALSGALCGFLVWNAPGKLFAGDAGALFVGAALGGLSLILVKLRPDWLLIPPTLLLPFLVDVLLTLAWRTQRGKRLFSAHRDHAYQIAMKAGLKHWQVAGVHAVWAANAAGIGVMAAIMGGYVPLVAFLGLLVASCWVHLRVRKSGESAGLVGANVP